MEFIYEHPETKARFYQNQITKNVDKYASDKGLSQLSCMIVLETTGNKTYILCEEINNQRVPFYESPRLDEISARVDILSVSHGRED